ncbi:MAG: hypothetical protein COB04_01330 [Gammaproteobacteria bacterium]|nr:MAG: hypothetical protein COB04_01330 [Gammaproteobacteria bacterium]
MLLIRLFNLPRSQKKNILISFDLASLFVAYWVSMYSYSNWAVLPEHWAIHCFTISIVALFLFGFIGLYSTMNRFLGPIEILKIIFSVVLCAICFVVVNHANGVLVDLGSGSVFCGVMTFSTMVSRIFIVELYSLARADSQVRVLIYGVGELGVKALERIRENNKVRIVAMVVEDERLCGININGIKVQAVSNLERLIKNKRVEQVHLALSNEMNSGRRELIGKLQGLSVGIKLLDLHEDKDEPQDGTVFRNVNVEDIISRDGITALQPLLDRCIKHKVVLITGAGGCIGAALGRQIVELLPKHLVLVDGSDVLLSELQRELLGCDLVKSGVVAVTPILGVEIERRRLKEIINAFGVETIYHSEAYQQVPLMEHNIVSAVQRNLFGVRSLMDAIRESSVKDFILVSTDKVVRPTSYVGVTRRLSEQVVQCYSNKNNYTKYCVVRCGNLLEARDSVVSVFQRQIRKGEPVSITHRDMARHFISAKQAAKLVIQAGSLSKEGEIFIIDMGDPIKVVDLLEKLAQLMGKQIRSKDCPNGNVEINHIGIRAGEKVFEELSTGDNPWGTEHPDILVSDEVVPLWSVLNEVMSELKDASDRYDCETIRSILEESDVGFTPKGKMLDSVWSRLKNNNGLQDNVVSVLSFDDASKSLELGR